MASPSGSARALEGPAIGPAHDLVLEALEEELATAARAERLLGLTPGGLLAARLVVRGTKLVHGRAPRLRGHEHLAETVAAEIAVELSSNSHRGPPRPSLRSQERCQWMSCSRYPQMLGRVPLSATHSGPPPDAPCSGGGTAHLLGGLGLDLEADEGARVRQVRELLDDALGNDVEVVVAVVLALV